LGKFLMTVSVTASVTFLSTSVEQDVVFQASNKPFRVYMTLPGHAPNMQAKHRSVAI
jgi:hypothetical protein